MSHWLRPRGLRCLDQTTGGANITTLRKQHRLDQLAGFKLISVPGARLYHSSRALASLSMSSASRRLGQLNEQVRKPSARPYSSAGSSANSTKDAKVISTVREHSPGHNVATLTLSNPNKLNIVNTPLIEQLIAKCQELSRDDKLRAVILAGAPTAAGKAPSWIGGADIKEMSGMSSYDQAKQFITTVHLACKALRDIPVPVIARVHGFSLGAGLEIMAACDLRIATELSTFGMPEVKIGLPSVVEAALLPGLIGMGRTRRLLYLAENISADVAERWGLIEKIVSDEAELDQAVDEWVGMIVSMGPKCIRSQKQLMQKWENSTVDEGIQAGVEALAEAFEDGGQEPRELMEKFLNRKR